MGVIFPKRENVYSTFLKASTQQQQHDARQQNYKDDVKTQDFRELFI